jgi:chemotaxis protein MotB
MPIIDLRPSLALAASAKPPAAPRPVSAPAARVKQEVHEKQEAQLMEFSPRDSGQVISNRPRPLARLCRQEGSPSFYVSLSDLMCLLLVFFVLIFSLTEKGGSREVTPEASQALARSAGAKPVVADPFPQPTLLSQSLRKGLMGLTSLGQADPGLAAEQAATVARPLPGGVELNTKTASPAQEHQRLLSQVRAETRHIAGLEVAVKGESVLLRLPEVLLFAPGKAEINPSLQPVLNRVGQALHNFPQARVKITGHTDDRPIHTAQYASNWELSGARAAMVARSLAKGGVKPARITIQGLADHSPLLPNVNDYNRARNRRVEVEIEL